MNKRKLGALVAATMLTLTFAGTALANDVHQELPIVGTDFKSTIVACGEGWHFVHVGAKADALPSELTATFKDAGTVKVDGYVNGNGIVMYNVHVDPSDRLLSASDDISDDANLNLSHVCLAETTTSSTTTTANDTTSDETTADETTTTDETDGRRDHRPPSPRPPTRRRPSPSPRPPTSPRRARLSADDHGVDRRDHDDLEHQLAGDRPRSATSRASPRRRPTPSAARPRARPSRRACCSSWQVCSPSSWSASRPRPASAARPRTRRPATAAGLTGHPALDTTRRVRPPGRSSSSRGSPGTGSTR